MSMFNSGQLKGPNQLRALCHRVMGYSIALMVASSCNQSEFYQKDYLDSKAISPDGTTSADGTGTGTSTTPGNGNTNDPTNPGGGTGNPSDPTNPTGGTGNPTDPTNPGGGGTGNPTDPTNPGGGTGPVLCNGVGYKETNDRFVQNVAQEGKVDILWVIDNSGSMSDEQQALAHNFEVFISEFITRKVDFKMAITTTDGTKNYNGNIVGNSDKLLTSANAQANEAKFMSDFKKLVNVGITGSGVEVGLQTSQSFVTKNGAGFLRPDAFLVIVVLSDEEDQSSGKVSAYVDYLKGQKKNPGLVKIYSIVNTLKTATVYETAGLRYMEASQATGGTVSSIKEDFYVTLRDMGGKILELVDSFPLSGVPVNENFKILVDNSELKSGWSYDKVSRAIKFDPGNIPDEGSIVIVYYNVSCS